VGCEELVEGLMRVGRAFEEAEEGNEDGGCVDEEGEGVFCCGEGVG